MTNDPLNYSGGDESGRPGAELSESGMPCDTSVYPGSQGSGHAVGHKGHKMGGHMSHSEHPSPKSLGHHHHSGKSKKY